MVWTDADGDARVAPDTSSSTLSALNPKKYVDGTMLKGWDLALLIIWGLVTALSIGFSTIIGAVLGALEMIPAGLASWIATAGNGLVGFVVNFGFGIWSSATGFFAIVPSMLLPIVTIAFVMIFFYIIIRGEQL